VRNLASCLKVPVEDNICHQSLYLNLPNQDHNYISSKIQDGHMLYWEFINEFSRLTCKMVPKLQLCNGKDNETGRRDCVYSAMSIVASPRMPNRDVPWVFQRRNVMKNLIPCGRVLCQAFKQIYHYNSTSRSQSNVSQK
jgi:hypothetical protein